MSFVDIVEENAITEATNLNFQPVKETLGLVNLVYSDFLKFKFRNGPLRRKFDALKYSVKNLENKARDASFLSNGTSNTGNGHQENYNLDLNNLSQMYEKSDDYRETVIKNCRDVQKKAKRAIFLLHDNKVKPAGKMILEAIADIQRLEKAEEELTEVYPDSIYNIGSYKSCLEELIEALLFYSFLTEIGKEEPLQDLKSSSCLSFTELGQIIKVTLSPMIYIGGLSDFTGEIGRFGVNAATRKDLQAVNLCVNLMEEVKELLESVNELSPSPLQDNRADSHNDSITYYEKKLRSLHFNLKKMKDIYYDEVIYKAKLDSLNQSVDHNSHHKKQKLDESIPNH